MRDYIASRFAPIIKKNRASKSFSYHILSILKGLPCLRDVKPDRNLIIALLQKAYTQKKNGIGLSGDKNSVSTCILFSDVAIDFARGWVDNHRLWENVDLVLIWKHRNFYLKGLLISLLRKLLETSVHKPDISPSL